MAVLRGGPLDGATISSDDLEFEYVGCEILEGTPDAVMVTVLHSWVRESLDEDFIYVDP